MNSSFLHPTGTALLMMGLALMIGGMLALGAFTAPVLFRAMPRPEAGEAMTLIFRRYDSVLLVGLGLVVLGEVLRLLSAGLPTLTPVIGIRFGVMALLVGMMLYSILTVNPQIEAMQKAGVTHGATEEGKRFSETHQMSEKLYKIELAVAVVLLILTPFV